MEVVDLRGHFSSPEALIGALEEMEKVLATPTNEEDEHNITPSVQFN